MMRVICVASGGIAPGNGACSPAKTPIGRVLFGSSDVPQRLVTTGIGGKSVIRLPELSFRDSFIFNEISVFAQTAN
ncbi:hypothetical protein [Fluviicoccus keumensis]|uniref:hypothetical protein n=1 Tax=Fluviicoccus keumensis TaxID=1435465 RepID=UPI0013EE5A7D|nr:hypothetical protein [Fluviicoccus keumensis]